MLSIEHSASGQALKRIGILKVAETTELNTTSILLAASIELRVKGARDLMHLKATP